MSAERAINNAASKREAGVLRKFLAPALGFIIGSVIFALSNTFLPLYTSNQNTYFYHGLANGGLGFLSRDWLVNTVDPFPVFSFLVTLTYRYLTQTLFHFYYVILMGIYLFSMVGIISSIFGSVSLKAKRLFFFALVVGVHALIFAVYSPTIFGINLRELQAGVAGQYILGPIFQPSLFGVLIVLAIYLFLSGKRLLPVFLLALACTFHSTYLLGGATLTLSFMLIEYLENKSFKSVAQIGLLALILVAPIVIYNYLYFAPSDSQVARNAEEILVNFRIPHHAQIKTWLDISSFSKLLLVVFATVIVRKTRLFWIMAISLIAAVALTILQALTGSYALALLFPWRLSVYLVPLSTFIILGFIFSQLVQRFHLQGPGINRGLIVLSVIIIAMSTIGGIVLTKRNFEGSAKDDSIAPMEFVKRSVSAGEIYLVPVEMERFRIYTGAPIVVDYKSHPYKDTEVVEWYRRFESIKQFYANTDSIDCRQLKALIAQYGVTDLVLNSNLSMKSCDFAQQVYRDNKFTIYHVDQRNSHQSFR